MLREVEEDQGNLRMDLRSRERLESLLNELSTTITPSYWEKQQSNKFLAKRNWLDWKERYATMKNNAEENPNSFYFIDYEDLLENGDDQYHVLYGVKEELEFADYIASFDSEDDALEYVDWKNMSLPEVFEEDENLMDPDKEIEELNYDNKWNS